MKQVQRLILSAVMLSFLVSCATTHPGHKGSVVGLSPLPLIISAKTVEPDIESSFQLIEFTVENSSADWLKIGSSRFVIEDPAKSKISVVLGDDLYAWAEAQEFKKEQDNYGKKLIQTGLVGLGTVAMVAGGKDEKVLGAIAAVGSASWMGIDMMVANYKKTNGVLAVPKNHFYEPLSIPGKMFLRRWLLLNKPAGTILTKIVVQLNSVDGTQGVYEINL